MVTTLPQSVHICASVPDPHCWTTAAMFESFKSDKTVKNAIFTAFYGILRHFLVKIPTEFFIFCLVTFVHMYITALHGWLCWGIFKKLPQLRRGVVFLLSLLWLWIVEKKLGEVSSYFKYLLSSVVFLSYFLLKCQHTRLRSNNLV